MTDREKVKKGLEIILNGCDEIQCEDCCFHIKEPTKPRRCGMIEEQIQEGALKLIEELEERIAIMEESRRWISTNDRMPKIGRQVFGAVYGSDKVIDGLKFTKAMITFNPLTGEDIEPENLNEENKTTYDACVGAIAMLKEQEAVKVQYTAMGGLRYGACPRCDARIDNLVNPKACGVCGQAVKWE